VKWYYLFSPLVLLSGDFFDQLNCKKAKIKDWYKLKDKNIHQSNQDGYNASLGWF
jgi:hypothetical protein